MNQTNAITTLSRPSGVGSLRQARVLTAQGKVECGHSTVRLRGQPLHIAPLVIYAKRLIDIALGLVLAILLLPIALLVTMMIWAGGTGPALFRQKRVGGILRMDEASGVCEVKEFVLYKFRSMVVDAERGTGAVLATHGDPRLIPMGRFLRATRLDEIPQIWNVLRGDLSLVGPRPERLEILQQAAVELPKFAARLGVKQGITGLAQVSLDYHGYCCPRAGLPWDKMLSRSVRENLQCTLTFNQAYRASNYGQTLVGLENKLVCDTLYGSHLQRLGDYLTMELRILFLTPLIMVFRRGQ